MPYRQINKFSQKGNRKKLSYWPDLCIFICFSRKTTEELGRRTSSFVMTGNNGVSGNPPSGKKRKHDAGLDDLILVPVARANFENVNQVWPLALFFSVSVL